MTDDAKVAFRDIVGQMQIECSRFENQREARYALGMTDKSGTELFSITSVERVSDLLAHY